MPSFSNGPVYGKRRFLRVMEKMNVQRAKYLFILDLNGVPRFQFQMGC